ncbi:hypothetical protein HU200_014615 [Digitaria exilis]|uniref:Protein kinase domain-containing protein n=1 Tax=Digitaria exilis TaxID=1010633 RepID=A0A835FB07_9POAL|nr:hypothetical protein HU200_014615 [Digitaria exilis]
MESRDSFLRPPAPSYAAGASARKGTTTPTGGDTAASNLTSSSGSSTSRTLSPNDNFLKQVNAAIKRQRPLGSICDVEFVYCVGIQMNYVICDVDQRITDLTPVLSNVPRATRVLVSRADNTNKAGPSPSETKNSEGKVMQPQRIPSTIPRATRVLVSRAYRTNQACPSPSETKNREGKVMQQPQRGLLGHSRPQNAMPDQQNIAGNTKLGCPDELMLTTPSMLQSVTDTGGQIDDQNYQHKNEVSLLADRVKSSLEASSQIASRNALVAEGFKKEQLYSIADPQLTSQTGESLPVKQGAHYPQPNHQELGIADAAVDMDIKYDAPNLSQSQRGIEDAHNLNHGEPLTRCSAIGSCVTAMSLHSGPTVQSSQAPQISGYASPVQRPESAVPESSKGVLGHGPQKERTGVTGIGDWNPLDQQDRLGNGATDKAVSSIGSLRSEVLPANDQSTSARDGGAPRPNKGEKERHKKNYDPNVFFKVNGKLYQKLGKIGSGGSSEVHKVISSDCIIYALKKIKLRGRDYPTAYGFCQEIEYLNKLKGKSNIIQLIDYEVTDKSLILEGSISPRDGRIKDDHYIYMVLEYGEIDLAHMVAQKWQERSNSNMKIDENWLRFYWQQMLEAVNTIHDERIVHSDLKPANFMLVRGSLKLIDFGIAKAIMNDTTNIQRDAQVGTLNYMSPEAFMCNDTDSGDGLWCLAWDRNERWRIPQLLEHPFLNPLVPRELPAVDHDPCRLLVERIRVHWDNPVVQKLRSEIEKLDEYHC